MYEAVPSYARSAGREFLTMVAESGTVAENGTGPILPPKKDLKAE